MKPCYWFAVSAVSRMLLQTPSGWKSLVIFLLIFSTAYHFFNGHIIDKKGEEVQDKFFILLMAKTALLLTLKTLEFLNLCAVGGVFLFLESIFKITDCSQFFSFTFADIGIPERGKLSISPYSIRHHRNSLNGLILTLAAPQSLSLSPMSSKQIMHLRMPASWHMLPFFYLETHFLFCPINLP